MVGLFFFPGSDGFRFSADAANSAGRSRGPVDPDDFEVGVK